LAGELVPRILPSRWMDGWMDWRMSPTRTGPGPRTFDASLPNDLNPSFSSGSADNHSGSTRATPRSLIIRIISLRSDSR
jgi:hypothetical protein